MLLDDRREIHPSDPSPIDQRSKISILIVDDDPSVRISLKQLLGQHYAVFDVDNGLKALALIAKREFDLVILDLKMPGPDGLEVLREIKQLRPHTGVLIYSAFGHKENMKTAIKYAVARGTLVIDSQELDSAFGVEAIDTTATTREERPTANEALGLTGARALPDGGAPVDELADFRRQPAKDPIPAQASEEPQAQAVDPRVAIKADIQRLEGQLEEVAGRPAVSALRHANGLPPSRPVGSWKHNEESLRSYAQALTDAILEARSKQASGEE